MNSEEIIKYYENTINELKSIYEKVVCSEKINLSDDNIYLGISFVSKIIGLNSIFSDEFIKDNNLKSVVDWIDKKTVMIQASHYSDKGLFYEFFNVIFPQLEYRLSQIKFRNSLSKEEREKLVITAEYQVYLYNNLKYYLEQTTTDEIREKIKEILSIINLYKVVSDPSIVALGSKIVYIDTSTNEVSYGRIVLNSHSNMNYHKFPLSKFKSLFLSKANDIVCLDFSTSFFVRILEVDNSLES